jgi:ABC-type Zn2+ transport system substrate-binding protein/surface adhesin
MSNRTHRPSFAAALQRWLLAIVAIAVVGAQSYGGLHRIEHAHLAAGGAAFDASHEAHGHDHDHDHAHDFATDDSGDGRHNCAAIDALALGDGPPATTSLAAAEEPATGARFAAAAVPAAHARPCPFEARAPPSHFS